MRDQIHSLCVEMVKLCMDNPGMKVAIVSTLDQWLMVSMLNELEPILHVCSPSISEVNYASRYVSFMNGSRLTWKAYGTTGKVMGWEAHTIWMHEVGLGTGYITLSVLQRLRARSPVYPKRWILTNEST